MKIVRIARNIIGDLTLVWDGKAVYLKHGARILECHDAATAGTANAVMREVEWSLDRACVN